MKIAIAHFTQQIPICGAFAPKSLNLAAKGDAQFVTAMELDFVNRGLWLETNGQRTPGPMRGRLFVPMERVVIAVPAPPEVTPEPKKGAKKTEGGVIIQ
jgi:hypothetical protein